MPLIDLGNIDPGNKMIEPNEDYIKERSFKLYDPMILNKWACSMCLIESNYMLL